MKTKELYTTPTTDSLELLQETVICGSYDATDSTEIFQIDDELYFASIL